MENKYNILVKHIKEIINLSINKFILNSPKFNSIKYKLIYLLKKHKLIFLK